MEKLPKDVQTAVADRSRFTPLGQSAGVRVRGIVGVVDGVPPGEKET
jgi:hypothetical protein